MDLEQQRVRCQESLDMGIEARRAFARRQEILISQDGWSLVRWYNDEDFCRAYNTAVHLTAEVKRLREALPDPKLLRALADWLDGKQKGVLEFGIVQGDLRAMAEAIDAAKPTRKAADAEGESDGRE